MNRYSAIFLSLLGLAGGLYWFSENGSHSLESYIQNSDLLTLETRYTADAIMNMHKAELIGNSGRTFQEPSLQFHPYLLLDVKYYDKNHKTRQGHVIWSQVDGEMVLNTANWEQTRGFADAINANATPLEFQLLNALADNRGTLSREKIEKELGLAQDPTNALINSVKQKNLVLVKGNDVILHFENPLFHVPPQTKMDQELVIQPYRQGKKVPALYSRSKIERIAKAAFGEEFTIRHVEEIYLPVIRIGMLNKDGSFLSADWNALTGQKMNTKSILR